MNNDQHPLLGALGLCRKAGKLLHGYDRVQENALRGKVALVLLTADRPAHLVGTGANQTTDQAGAFGPAALAVVRMSSVNCVGIW